jgi:pyridoxamine 5'-phosphate oxidase
MRTGLDRATAGADPRALLRRWLDEAAAAGVLLPAAMTLATVRADGAPAARAVILRGLDERGLVLYTSTASPKAQELAAEPRAALLFTWAPLERQVRVEGRAEPVDAEETAAFWAARPADVRLAEWASEQSRPVADRAALEAALRAARERHRGDPPLPPHFGGYRVVPARFEFWQGRDDRLHDRLLYTRAGDGWTVTRLQP